MKTIFSLVAAVALLGVAACNTVEGAGEDIESAGDEVSDTANDAAN
jgi:predicted small secreted protein